MAHRAPGFFDVDERLAALSAKGDDLECVKGLVDFEMFRPALEAAVPRADQTRGGRPPFDHVLMSEILILQAMHSLSDERAEFLIKERLSFMRFLGLGLSDNAPAPKQRNTIAEKDALRDGASPANGRTSLPGSRRRIGTPAGRSNTPRRSPARTAVSRPSISPFPPSASRTTCRSTRRSGSYAIGLRRMRWPMTGPGLKRSSTVRTPPATYGTDTA